MQANEKTIRALDAIAGKLQRIPIDGQPSLYLQVTGKPGAPVKSWVFRYRLLSGQQINHTLGRWPGLSWSEVKRQMPGLRDSVQAGRRIATPKTIIQDKMEAVTQHLTETERLASALDKLDDLREAQDKFSDTQAKLADIEAELVYVNTLIDQPPASDKVQALVKAKAKLAYLKTRLGQRAAQTSTQPAPADLTPTVHALGQLWLDGHVKVKNQPSTAKFQTRIWTKHVEPNLGQMKITELRPAVVFALLDGLAETPIMANRLRALLSKFWNWSSPRTSEMAGLVNPVTGWDRNPEASRERVMTEAEIIALGEAFRAKPNGLRAAALFLLLTGARAGVVENLRPEDIDLESRVLRFPASRPGLKGCRRVYFSASAAALLGQFPTPVLTRSLWRQWSALRIEAKIPDVSLHDLRRTFASWGINHGHDGAAIHALQGHSLGKVQAAYQIYADPTMTDLAERIGEALATLLGIALPKPKATPNQPTHTRGSNRSRTTSKGSAAS